MGSKTGVRYFIIVFLMPLFLIYWHPQKLFAINDTITPKSIITIYNNGYRAVDKDRNGKIDTLYLPGQSKPVTDDPRTELNEITEIIKKEEKKKRKIRKIKKIELHLMSLRNLI